MSNVTRILTAIDQGDPPAAEQLLPLVYDELRRLAAQRLSHEKPGQTLQATALVHEVYLRLVGSGDRGWDSRGHFFSAAAEAMRRILLNRARDKKRLKRATIRKRIDLQTLVLALDAPPDELLELDEAIRDLSQRDPVAAELVKLRFFAGLSHQDASASLGLTRRQGDRHWAYARAWLFDRLRHD